MEGQPKFSYQDGQSSNRLPLFNGLNYSYWKTWMRIFIQASEFKLWIMIINGPYVPSKLANNVSIPKLTNEWNKNDEWLAQLNAKARNLLYYALSASEFNWISTCSSLKKIWDRLEVTHEETIQVKESKISMLVQKYEIFQLKKMNQSQACLHALQILQTV